VLESAPGRAPMLPPKPGRSSWPQQRELGPQHPCIQALCAEVILPACEALDPHVIRPPAAQGRGP